MHTHTWTKGRSANVETCSCGKWRHAADTPAEIITEQREQRQQRQQRQRFTHGGRIPASGTPAARETYVRGSWGDPSTTPVEYAQRRAAHGDASAEDYAILARYWDGECRRMIRFATGTPYADTPTAAHAPCSTCGETVCAVRVRLDDPHYREAVCDACVAHARAAAIENATTFAARTLHFARRAAEAEAEAAIETETAPETCRECGAILAGMFAGPICAACENGLDVADDDDTNDTTEAR